MTSFSLFQQIRSGSHRDDIEIRNHEALGVSGTTRGVRIVWMYPDVLQMHGGRGDAMALLHFSTLMGLPCTIRKVSALTDPIPFAWADMLLFPPGDLAAMEDICHALRPHEDSFQSFADAGKVILANGSSGAILAEGTKRLDGSRFRGLGLLHMQLRQRVKVYGNDLWIDLDNGLELLGPQIQMADVRLRPGQKPFGTVRYGRGNNEKKDEGARTNNVIFTHVLGPVLVKNPLFTQEILCLAAETAGILTNAEKAGLHTLTDEDIRLEQESLADLKTFIQKKIDGVITW